MNKAKDEIWRDVEGYEGIYQVSNHGRVRSLDRYIIYSNGVKHLYHSLILKQSLCAGYLYVGLNKNKIQKSYRVHRLVGMAFIQNKNNYPEINHIDYNKTNNYVSNLEWVDRFMQNRHSAKKQNRKWGLSIISKNRKGEFNHKSKPVIRMDLEGNVIKRFESGCIAQNETGVRQTKISAVCLNNRKSAGGYRWKFADALLEELSKEE
jgi:hypothetical protein